MKCLELEREVKEKTIESQKTEIEDQSKQIQMGLDAIKRFEHKENKDKTGRK